MIEAHMYHALSPMRQAFDDSRWLRQTRDKRSIGIRKPSLYPAELREHGGSLLSSVHANKCASGVAGEDSAVGKNRDGPAAALENLGLGGWGESLGGGGAEGKFTFFAEDE